MSCPLFSNKETEKLLEGKLFILNNKVELKGNNIALSLLSHALEATKRPPGHETAKCSLRMPPEGLSAQGHSRKVSANAVGENIWLCLLMKIVASGCPYFFWQMERAHPRCPPKEMGSASLHGWLRCLSSQEILVSKVLSTNKSVV